MKAVAEHYFLTDLDGTLLRSNALPSAFTIEVMKAALSKGAVCSYATARGFLSSSKATAGIPWGYPLVLFNGAMILDPVSLRVLDGFWMESALADEVIGVGRRLGLMPLLFALDGGDRERVLHEKLVRTGDLDFYRSRPGDPRFHEMEHLRCPADYRALSLSYIGLYKELAPLQEAAAEIFGDQIHMNLMKDNYIKDHYFLEISHPRANKKDGLLLWARLVGCDPSEVTVFGDNLNDAGMFEAAGFRVAVANAHPNLLQQADHVAGPNDEDGVACYVKTVLGL